MISVYIHYPFCVRKCQYCDFLSGPAPAPERKAYMAALERDIVFWGNALRHEDGAKAAVDSVFLGGGTPSLMEAEDLEGLMEKLSGSFDIQEDAEITMECNPGTVDEAKLRRFRGAGVNRLSIGVQSFRDEELSLLGRIHTAKEAEECFLSARNAGFGNLSMDLMSALPGQSYEEFMFSLKKAADLSPEHLSVYSLIVEEGTPFFEKREAGELPPLPEDEEDRRMYHETAAFLAEKGYGRYEISNYARPGYESRHNTGYWTGHAYIGIGAGASSYLDHERFCAPSGVRAYMEAPAGTRCGIERLSRKAEMEEFMFLGLRMMRGVSEKDFSERFPGEELMRVYGDIIRKHEKNGLLVRKEGRVFLTEYGIDISNYVMSDFLFDD